MTSRTKFLIVSNGRTGSTWLETMLGELPDVEVDYEFKWAPRYPSSPSHMVIPSKDFSCSQALEGISSTAPIVGSKLVLDPSMWLDRNDDEYRELKATIDKDIRIIHLKRNYADTFFSHCRGYANMLRVRDRSANSKILASIENSLSEDTKYNLVRKMIRDKKKQAVPPIACVVHMKALLENDKWIAILREQRVHFIDIDYSEIPSRFAEIVKFIGSGASKGKINDVLRNSPTKKLPSVRASEYIQNAEEIVKISYVFEAKKRLFNNILYLSDFCRLVIENMENNELVINVNDDLENDKATFILAVNAIWDTARLRNFLQLAHKHKDSKKHRLVVFIFSDFRVSVEILKQDDYSAYLESGCLQFWHSSEWKQMLRATFLEVCPPSSDVLVLANNMDPLAKEVIKDIDELKVMYDKAAYSNGTAA